jgi:hypothetical protein
MVMRGAKFAACNFLGIALLAVTATCGARPVDAFPGPPAAPQAAALAGPIPADQFAGLLRLIKPHPGELRFHEVPWLIDVWEARKKAAAEGKPILVWSGAGGSPLGVC